MLHPDGSLYLNIADTYADGHKGLDDTYRNAPKKSLICVPGRLAHAVQQAGWIIRERIIWNKPHPVPDSATDRRTPTYEFVYRLVTDDQYTDADSDTRSNLITIDTVKPDTDHSAAFPEALAGKLLDATFLDSPTDTPTVLDPMCGSGSTLVAAAKRDYNYLGFDTGADAAETAHKRLAPYDRDETSLTGQYTDEFRPLTSSSA